MRRPTIFVAVLALAAGGAFAQEIPSSGSRVPSTTGQGVPPAPVGHRQPGIKDLPPDVAHEELQPGRPPTQESQKDNTGRRLKTCPGCAGGPPTLQVGPSCIAAGAGSVPHAVPGVGAADGVVGAGVVVVARLSIGVVGRDADFDASSDAVGFTWTMPSCTLAPVESV